jgi:Pyruvate/2-oxoacid:ferredoxin oxidoreductase gamma subunit
MPDGDRRDEARDRPTAELMRELTDRTTTLVRKEIELAKAELTEKGKKAGVGAGMFGAAGLFAVGAFAAITTCLILALNTFMAGWLAALIVAVVYAAIAGALALRGKQEVKQASPPVPERAVDSTKEDLEWLKTRAKSGRSE